MGSALRGNREFRLLWAGQAVSALGSQISFVASPLLVLAITLAAGSVPFAQIVLVAFIDGSGFVVTSTAERGAVRQLVEPDLLGEAVARNEARMFGAMLAGPPLGGLLFGLGRAIPFLADAVSYAASVISKLLIKADFQDVRIHTDPKSAREGLRWVWERPFFRLCSLLFGGQQPAVHRPDARAAAAAHAVGADGADRRKLGDGARDLVDAGNPGTLWRWPIMAAIERSLRSRTRSWSHSAWRSHLTGCRAVSRQPRR